VGQLTEPELGGSTTAARVLRQANGRFGFGRHGATLAPCHARGVRWLVVLVLLAATAAHAAPCDELPVLATRGHVVVRGQLTRRQLKPALALVEGVVADVHRRFGAEPAKPLTLCLLGDANAYTRAASAFGDIPSEWGFYRPDLRIAIANVGQSIGNLRHELVHPLLGDDFPAIPAWLNEGIAALYGTSKPTAKGFTFLVNYRLRDLQRALKRGDLPTLAELAASTDEDVRGDRAATFYAMSRYVLLYAERHGTLGELYAAMRDASGDVERQQLILERTIDERAFRAWAAKLRY
jgi:hypothetical protein